MPLAYYSTLIHSRIILKKGGGSAPAALTDSRYNFLDLQAYRRRGDVVLSDVAWCSLLGYTWYLVVVESLLR